MFSLKGLNILPPTRPQTRSLGRPVNRSVVGEKHEFPPHFRERSGGARRTRILAKIGQGMQMGPNKQKKGAMELNYQSPPVLPAQGTIKFERRASEPVR